MGRQGTLMIAHLLRQRIFGITELARTCVLIHGSQWDRATGLKRRGSQVSKIQRTWLWEALAESQENSSVASCRSAAISSALGLAHALTLHPTYPGSN